MNWYEAQTLASPSWLRRIAQRGRHQAAAALAAVRPGERVLDYGAGDGQLIVALARAVAGATYAAYEPEPTIRGLLRERIASAGTSVEVCAKTDELRAPYDVVLCTEVLEHIVDARLPAIAEHLAALLSPGGRLIVSVPIEIGPASVVKNLVRSGQGKGEGSLRDVFWCAIGYPDKVRRDQSQWYVYQHLGFDYRAIPPLLARHGLRVQRAACSPLPLLGVAFNSQIHWMMQRREAA